MFEAGANLRVNSRTMTLRQAVECFRDMPEDARWPLGVGLQKMPTFHMASERPVAVGFLNASTLEKMIGLLPAD